MPAGIRVLTLVPYLVVLLVLVVVAMKVGWALFAGTFAVILAGSALFALWLVRRQRRG